MTRDQQKPSDAGAKEFSVEKTELDVRSLDKIVGGAAGMPKVVTGLDSRERGGEPDLIDPQRDLADGRRTTRPPVGGNI